MANLPLFWQVVVTILIIIGFIYLLALGVGVYGAKEKHKHKVIWDGDLEEGSAPVPSWWFWSGIIAAFFAVIYMVFYPSFGNYNGLLDLTNAKRYSESKSDIDNQYYKKLTTLAAMNTKALQDSAEAMRLAANVYAQNCAACHGKDAKGQNGFPDLSDQDWLWGNKTAQISHSITFGRKALMPPWQAVLGDEGVSQIANYIKSVADKAADIDVRHATGKAKYQQFCIACHAINLTGKDLLGAPNLADDVWLYGGDLPSIKASIALGRRGVMPAHKDRLTALQIKLLTAWLYNK